MSERKRDFVLRGIHLFIKCLARKTRVPEDILHKASAEEILKMKSHGVFSRVGLRRVESTTNEGETDIDLNDRDRPCEKFGWRNEANMAEANKKEAELPSYYEERKQELSRSCSTISWKKMYSHYVSTEFLSHDLEESKFAEWNNTKFVKTVRNNALMAALVALYHALVDVYT
jgi:hypothetical protein